MFIISFFFSILNKNQLYELLLITKKKIFKAFEFDYKYSKL